MNEQLPIGTRVRIIKTNHEDHPVGLEGSIIESTSADPPNKVIFDHICLTFTKGYCLHYSLLDGMLEIIPEKKVQITNIEDRWLDLEI